MEAGRGVQAVEAGLGGNITVTGVGGARAAGRAGDREVVNIGKSVLIEGELSGSEDLTVEGQVKGQIELKQHVFTVGPHGRIRGQISAKAVVVLGTVVGNIKASDKVSIHDTGTVEGDIFAPRVAIAEGARFRGKIDMQRNVKPKDEEKPGPEAAPQRLTQAQPQPQATSAAKAPASAPAGHSQSVVTVQRGTETGDAPDISKG